MKITRRHFKRLSRRSAAVSAKLLRSYDGQVSPPSPPHALQACCSFFPAPDAAKRLPVHFLWPTRPTTPEKKLPRSGGGAKRKNYSSPISFLILLSSVFRTNSSIGMSPAAFLIRATSSSEKELPTMRLRSGCSGSKSAAISCQRFSGMLVQESQLLTDAKETLSFLAN